jgi:ClpP class serine protease
MASRLARWWYLGRGGADHPLINVVKIQGIISQPGGQSRSPRTVNLEKLESTLERAFKSLRPAAVCVTVNSPGGAPGVSTLLFCRWIILMMNHR